MSISTHNLPTDNDLISRSWPITRYSTWLSLPKNLGCFNIYEWNLPSCVTWKTPLYGSYLTSIQDQKTPSGLSIKVRVFTRPNFFFYNKSYTTWIGMNSYLVTVHRVFMILTHSLNKPFGFRRKVFSNFIKNDKDPTKINRSFFYGKN